METGLSLGSNLGDRLASLREARVRIAALTGVKRLASSPVYETEPVGVRPEHRHLGYLNAVLIVDVSISADRLSDAIHAIEAGLGRVRGGERYAPRPIDIDILYVGDEQRADPQLTVPHPAWAERRFVVQPLADVCPALIMPGDTRTCREVLSTLPDTPRAIVLHKEW